MEIGGEIYHDKYYYKKSLILPHIYTACLLLNEQESVVGRGIAICSVFDSPSKKDGRKKSKDRAIKAVATKKSNELINVTNRGDFFTFKDFKNGSISKEELETIKGEYVNLLFQSKFEILSDRAFDNFDNFIMEYPTYTRILIPAVLPIALTNLEFSYKSEYSPTLTKNELLILRKDKN